MLGSYEIYQFTPNAATTAVGNGIVSRMSQIHLGKPRPIPIRIKMICQGKILVRVRTDDRHLGVRHP